VTSYDHDKANNRTEKVVTGGSSAGTWTFAHGTTADGYNSNQVKSVTKGATVTTFLYDLSGNRSEKKVGGTTVQSYGYDHENRLTTLTDSMKGSFAYSYDHRTRRVGRDETGASGTEDEVSFASGLSVQEYVNGSGTPTVEYVRGSDYGGGIGGVLYTIRGGSARSYNAYNSRGDVVSKTDQGGAITWQSSYEAFGTRTQEQGSTDDRQKANTKDEDPTGLLNEGMRYRDLEVGIFLTRDPAGFVDGPNVYTYVVQNPWSKFDPLGLDGADLRCDRQVARSVGVDYRQFQNDRAAAQVKVAKQVAAGTARVVDGVVSGVTVLVAANSQAPSASYSAAIDPVRPIHAIWNYDPVLEGSFLEYSPPTKDQAQAQAEAMIALQEVAAASQGGGKGRGPLPARRNARSGGAGSKSGGSTAQDVTNSNASKTGPTEPYNRQKHYGKTPTAADRKAAGAKPDEVLDHTPSLAERYYEGDPSINEPPGYLLTPAQRKTSAGDRSRMPIQPRADSNAQGGRIKKYSQDQKKKHGL
jgi:RHS repeat-associated protein